jgi:hypothetical protein
VSSPEGEIYAMEINDQSPELVSCRYLKAELKNLEMHPRGGYGYTNWVSNN